MENEFKIESETDVENIEKKIKQFRLVVVELQLRINDLARARDLKNAQIEMMQNRIRTLTQMSLEL